jgi:hypothetical protein
LDGAAVEETEGGDLILEAIEGVGFEFFDYGGGDGAGATGLRV